MCLHSICASFWSIHATSPCMNGRCGHWRGRTFDDLPALPHSRQHRDSRSILHQNHVADHELQIIVGQLSTCSLLCLSICHELFPNYFPPQRSVCHPVHPVSCKMPANACSLSSLHLCSREIVGELVHYDKACERQRPRPSGVVLLRMVASEMRPCWLDKIMLTVQQLIRSFQSALWYRFQPADRSCLGHS